MYRGSCCKKNLKYYNIGTVPKSNKTTIKRGNIDSPNTKIYSHSLSYRQKVAFWYNGRQDSTRKQKQNQKHKHKHNTICVGHLYIQTNTNNVNKT